MSEHACIPSPCRLIGPRISVFFDTFYLHGRTLHGRTPHGRYSHGRGGLAPVALRAGSGLLLSLFLYLLLLLQLLPGPATAASRAPAEGRRGMVVSSHAEAARAGHAMLARGGNAVDAAVATAFAVGVAQPFSTGIGGGAFILIRTGAGEVVAIDARETAPAAAHRDMFVQPGLPERPSVFGPLAVGTPGFVAGMALALERWGTLSLAEVLGPAIAIAREGFPVGAHHVRMVERMRPLLESGAFPETARIQLPPGGESVERGWRLVQPDLARSLEAIAAQGPKAFYEGDLAAKMVGAVQGRGGLLSAEDLASYEPKLREPVRGRYRELDVYSFPPPSSGGIVLVEVLNIVEGFDLAGHGAGSAAADHRVAEAMKLAFADRAAYMGDPDFVDIPVERLVSKEYGAEQRARINPPRLQRAPWTWGRGEAAIRVEGPGLPMDDSGTAHLSVTDAAGNAVAITSTINTPFGSGITVAGTGIVLNNEMDDFSVAPDTPNAYGLVDTRGANAVAPKKRPLSSMSPTIVVKEGRPFMVTGSPGGPRIISTTLLTILNVVDFGMDVQAAVSAPRFHHQWVPDKLFVESDMPADVVQGLRERGHVVDDSRRHWSSAQSIVIDPASGRHFGGSDPRSDGMAIGY
ncbi:MAG: gamma-glutamyltransferase [Deltaproteobacteria bacterium]|nr:gamma-glutamyltransferase [Deltaproteobacteria bacterium]MBW2416993.1 gamma-glutamyltransferase [Deltaproteobacteria bacterium]